MAHTGRYFVISAKFATRWATGLAVVAIAGTLLAAMPAITGVLPSQKAHAAGATPNCDTGKKLLGILPTWYEYFGADYGLVKSTSPFIPDTCGVISGQFTDHLLQVGLAVIDMLLRIGALVAVAFVMMGGFRYMSSQGEPKNIEGAMATIINSAIGLGIVVTAAALVSFIGNNVLKG